MGDRDVRDGIVDVARRSRRPPRRELRRRPAFSCNRGRCITTSTRRRRSIRPAVCIGYGDADYTGLTPRLYHFADSGWRDITTSIDGSSHTICGRSSSLSPFVVFAAGPPALTVPDSIVVSATGPDGAVVTYLASATSVFDSSPDVSCSPPPGSVFAIGTTTVSCRATDSGGGSATADFDVDVIGAASAR